MNASGRFQLSENWKKSLTKLNLIAENQITNAAWLLFGKGTINYNVHLGRFKTPSMVIDDKMLNGTLFDVIEKAMQFIIGHLRVRFDITGEQTQRKEIFEYPLAAVRELLLNAIVHRDYLSPIDVQIQLFDDYMSFYNPGKLYGNLTLEQLKKDDYPASTRNKLIAEAFYLTGDIEKYGSGLVRVRQAIKNDPKFDFAIEEAPNGIRTKLSILKNHNVTDNVTNSVTDSVTNKRQQKIIELLKATPSCSATQLAEILKVSRRTVLRDLKKLKEINKIKFIGSAKSGSWKVLDK